MKKRVSVIFATLLVALFVVLSGATVESADVYQSIWGSIWGDSDSYVDIADRLVPAGGSTGQVLTKSSGADWDTAWTTLPNWSPQISGLDSRISDLEETQYVFGLNMRVFDSRKMSWNVFANYSANRSKLDRVGVELTLKFGKSYEEKQIEDLRAEIAELKALLQN